MKAPKNVLVFILLLCCLGIIITASEASNVQTQGAYFAKGEARWRPWIIRDPWIIPPDVMHDAESLRCFPPQGPIADCVLNIYKSFRSNKKNFKGECCKTASLMGQHCFDRVFKNLQTKIKDYCFFHDATANSQD